MLLHLLKGLWRTHFNKLVCASFRDAYTLRCAKSQFILSCANQRAKQVPRQNIHRFRSYPVAYWFQGRSCRQKLNWIFAREERTPLGLTHQRM